jgi:hypothetical protein
MTGSEKRRETFWAGDTPFFEGVLDFTFSTTTFLLPIVGTWIAIKSWGALFAILIGLPILALIALGLFMWGWNVQQSGIWYPP